MEVVLNPEQKQRLNQLAARTGRTPEQVLEVAVDRILDYEERFLSAVEEGREAARRCQLLEHEDVVARIEQIFRS